VSEREGREEKASLRETETETDSESERERERENESEESEREKRERERSGEQREIYPIVRSGCRLLRA
jgi:hypothetical protein